MENYYLHYTGEDALAEAQAMCDEFQALASRPYPAGGIKNYNAENWAVPQKHPTKDEYIRTMDAETVSVMDIPPNTRVALDNSTVMTISEAEEGGWFPADDIVITRGQEDN